MMNTEEKDLYSILGVSKDANDDEIKKAYRKLSLKYHPDRQAGKSEAEQKKAAEKMSEINNAYTVLSDPQKRQQYDNQGMSFFDGFEGFNGFSGFDNFAESIFGGNPFRNHQQRSQNRQVKGSDIRITINLTIEEALSGCTKKLKYKRNVKCKSCNGKGGSGRMTCPYCHGTGMETTVRQVGPRMISQVTKPCTHCDGKGYKFEKTCSHCHGTGIETEENIVEISIPAAMHPNEAIVKKNLGNYAADENSIPGDFLAFINLKDDNRYDLTDFPNVHEKLYINWYDAMLGLNGYEVHVPGKGNVKIDIHECTDPYSSVIIKNAGFKLDNSRNLRGDYVFDIIYKTPVKLSDKQKELISQFKTEN